MENQRAIPYGARVSAIVKGETMEAYYVAKDSQLTTNPYLVSLNSVLSDQPEVVRASSVTVIEEEES